MNEQNTLQNPLKGETLKSAAGNQQLSAEVGLYAAIVAVGLAVRLFRLDQGAPLSTSEAQLALAALRGTAIPAGGSPLLYSLDSILFSIFGGSDGLARLIPALVGCALVAMPAFWRERVGRIGALGVAAILAISPVAIMASRTASGEVIVAAVTLGLITVADRYLRSGRSAWLYAGAVMLGLGLASSRSIYSALLTLLALGLVAAYGHADTVSLEWKTIRSTPGLLARLIGVLAATFAVGATALMWRPSGLSAAVDLFSAWLASFRTQGVTGWYWPFQVLAVYEPLAVVAGIVGLFIVIERADRFVGLLGTWVVVATLLVTTPAGRTNGDVLLIVLPLALLAGYALQALADSLRALRFSIEEGVSIVVILPVIAYFFLSLAGYANNPGTGLLASSMINLGPAAPFIPMFFALALMVIVIMLFAALSSAETAMRGGAMAALAVLVMVTWSTGWGAVQVRPGDPRELIAGPEATSPAVRELARDLAVLSADTTADPTTLPLVVQSPPDGVLGWYLRNMSDVHFVTTLDVSSAPQVLITTDAMSPALSGSYAGERFTLRHEWRIEGKSSNDVFKWLIYRRAELPSPTQQATLWVQQGQ